MWIGEAELQATALQQRTGHHLQVQQRPLVFDLALQLVHPRREMFLLGLEYHAIVRWEEALLESRLGQAYRDYAERVPRWVPSLGRGDRGLRRLKEGFSWRATFFSERGTFIAIALGYLVLWLKLRS